jgi:hypothetical protein
MHKLNGAIAAAALILSLGTGAAVAHANAEDAGRGGVDIPSVPEAWSPEGRAPYTP